MDKLQNQVLKFIRENDLIRRGNAVTVGLSGGADSVCLLLVLKDLRQLLKIRLQAVHVNHQLRGDEAVRDEAFCRELCSRFGVPFSAVSVNVRAFVGSSGMTEEEAARTLRYEALQKAAAAFAAEMQEPDRQDLKTPGRAVVAVAHHADDQAETILLNLLRGSGLKGLGGMRPKRDNIIRPLLGLSRSSIRDYLAERNISFVEDSTNFENDHTRNRIRNVILPEMEQSVNDRAAEHLAAAGAVILEADDYLAAEAAAFLEAGDPAEQQGDVRRISLRQTLLKEKAQIFRRYVIIEALRRLGVPLKDWGRQHFSEIDAALFKPKGTHLDLPGGVCADNQYRETVLSKK
ncbi:MAG: tRNA lysidine(34) synthetase TilS [Lachnospiraceae bacterium]|nr:tRNA lysidine(34) synthetase TilS [Lachnospiraceae bacterium]